MPADRQLARGGGAGPSLWMARRERAARGRSVVRPALVQSPLLLVGRGCQRQSHTLMCVQRCYLLILKFRIPSFVKIPEALAPVDQHVCVASTGGGPTWGLSLRPVANSRPLLDACGVPASAKCCRATDV